MIDTTTIHDDDTIADHLAKTRILLMEMHHDYREQHNADNCEAFDDTDVEHTRIHDLIRHNTYTAKKLGVDINEHPTYRAWKIGYDRVHNPTAPYLQDLDD